METAQEPHRKQHMHEFVDIDQTQAFDEAICDRCGSRARDARLCVVAGCCRVECRECPR